MSSVHRLTRLSLLLLIATAFAGCGKTEPKAATGMPPVEVAVITVTPQRLVVANELPGRLEASRVAQVRARAAGIVLQRVFREGSDVKAGEVLFRIDPAPFQAAFASTEAAVAKADANLAQANLKVQRYQPLVEQNAVSKQEFDDALTAQKQAVAELAASRAARQTASLNLGYATVTAPIAGRTGRAQVTEGALVGQGEATPLTTVQQIDPIYVNLTQSSTELLQLRRALAAGKLSSTGAGQAKVTLVTDDGQPYPHAGKLLFSDLTVDESSGAISLRAEFPNPDRFLLPGMYVRARLEQAVNEQALTVPQQAIIRGMDGASVMVVGSDGKVSARSIKADVAHGNSSVVSEGLQAGEQVVVEGLQKIRPGAAVKAVAWKGPVGQTPVASSATDPQATADKKPNPQ